MFGERAYALAMAIGLVPIARRAILSAYYGAPFTIEMMMTIAAGGAAALCGAGRGQGGV